MKPSRLDMPQDLVPAALDLGPGPRRATVSNIVELEPGLPAGAAVRSIPRRGGSKSQARKFFGIGRGTPSRFKMPKFGQFAQKPLRGLHARFLGFGVLGYRSPLSLPSFPRQNGSDRMLTEQARARGREAARANAALPTEWNLEVVHSCPDLPRSELATVCRAGGDSD